MVLLNKISYPTWWSSAAIALFILIIQTWLDKYEENTLFVWLWFVVAILPTCLLLIEHRLVQPDLKLNVLLLIYALLCLGTLVSSPFLFIHYQTSAFTLLKKSYLYILPVQAVLISLLLTSHPRFRQRIEPQPNKGAEPAASAKYSLLDLVKRGKLDKVFHELLENKELDPDSRNEFLMLNLQLLDANKKFEIGLIAFEEYEKVRNRITFALLKKLEQAETPNPTRT